MDTHDWAYYADCSRLKTKRKKRRLQKQDRDKQLIQLRLEMTRISSEMRSPVYEVLDAPYQRGWKRTFALRHDLRRHPDADFFTTLLDKINTVQLSHRKDFKKKKRKFGRRIYVEKPQALQEVDHYLVKKYELTEKEMKYFVMEHRYCARLNYMQQVYVFKEPWRFVLKVSPNMITKVRIVDCDLVARLAQIDRFLVTHNLKARLWKLHHGTYSYSDRDPQPKMKYLQLLKLTAAEIMDAAENDKI